MLTLWSHDLEAVSRRNVPGCSGDGGGAKALQHKLFVKFARVRDSPVSMYRCSRCITLSGVWADQRPVVAKVARLVPARHESSETFRRALQGPSLSRSLLAVPRAQRRRWLGLCSIPASIGGTAAASGPGRCGSRRRRSSPSLHSRLRARQDAPAAASAASARVSERGWLRRPPDGGRGNRGGGSQGGPGDA